MAGIIYESAKHATPLSSKQITKVRSRVRKDMERLLAMWIDNLNKSNMSNTQLNIMEKAKSLFNESRRVRVLPMRSSLQVVSGSTTFLPLVQTRWCQIILREVTINIEDDGKKR